MHIFPRGMRFSTLEERGEFYSSEFDLRRTKGWLGKRKNTIFAMVVGRHTGIYPQEYSSVKKNAVIIDDYRDLDEVREYLLRYLPEGVYYDRNLYADINACEKCGKSYRDCWGCEGFLGQELAFDLDPENIRCPWHGSIKEKMARGQGLSFCMHEFNAVRRQTLSLYQELAEKFEELRVVYSGRGFHIHVLDKDAARLSRKERRKLAKEFGRKYAIDEWVTAGEMRLIRLPYSLNGIASRICLPLEADEIKGFDPGADRRCLPRFLATSSSP